MTVLPQDPELPKALYAWVQVCFRISVASRPLDIDGQGLHSQYID